MERSDKSLDPLEGSSSRERHLGEPLEVAEPIPSPYKQGALKEGGLLWVLHTRHEYSLVGFDSRDERKETKGRCMVRPRENSKWVKSKWKTR
jgi:hypothetical protein